MSRSASWGRATSAARSGRFAEILEKRMAVQNLFPVFLGYDLSEKKRLGIIAA
jgi:hypothetical protein